MTRSKRSGSVSRDIVDEAISGLFARPGRTLLTILGTVIGITALIATLGLSRTAANQVAGRFDELTATEIVVKPRQNQPPDTLPFDASERLERLNGVAAAGSLATLDIGETLVTAVPTNDPRGQSAFQINAMAVSPELFDASLAHLSAGRLFDHGHSDRGDRVVVLGRNAAFRLGITRVDHQPTVTVGDYRYVVIGIIDDTARQSTMLGSIIMPEGTARADWGLQGPDTVQVLTDLGATDLIASQAAIALSPADPTRLTVEAPAPPPRVKDGVQNDLEGLFLLLGAIALLVGTIGIANVTLVSVLERTGEIGLRRSLGATHRHIVAQFLFESTATGLAGGLLGATAGTLTIVGVAASKNWTPVLEPWLPFAAAGIGAATGLAAGLYPALRAASLEPVEALRHGT